MAVVNESLRIFFLRGSRTLSGFFIFPARRSVPWIWMRSTFWSWTNFKKSLYGMVLWSSRMKMSMKTRAMRITNHIQLLGMTGPGGRRRALRFGGAGWRGDGIWILKVLRERFPSSNVLYERAK